LSFNEEPTPHGSSHRLVLFGELVALAIDPTHKRTVVATATSVLHRIEQAALVSILAREPDEVASRSAVAWCGVAGRPPARSLSREISRVSRERQEETNRNHRSEPEECCCSLGASASARAREGEAGNGGGGRRARASMGRADVAPARNRR
jgi:hypothetical protein